MIVFNRQTTTAGYGYATGSVGNTSETRIPTIHDGPSDGSTTVAISFCVKTGDYFAVHLGGGFQYNTYYAYPITLT